MVELVLRVGILCVFFFGCKVCVNCVVLVVLVFCWFLVNVRYFGDSVILVKMLLVF